MHARANNSGTDTTDANDNNNDTASSTKVNVKEGPCLGACQYGPCIGIEHDEYNGCVALEGMTEEEFSNTVFLNIVTEEDADRVWSCVTNAVQLMAEADADDSADDDDDDAGET